MSGPGQNFQGEAGLSDTHNLMPTLISEKWTVFITSTDWCLSALVLLATGETGGVIIDCAWRDNFSGFMSWTFKTGNTGYLLKKENKKYIYTSCHYTHTVGKTIFRGIYFLSVLTWKQLDHTRLQLQSKLRLFFATYTSYNRTTALTHLLTTLITFEG